MLNFGVFGNHGNYGNPLYFWLTKAFTTIARGLLPSGTMVSTGHCAGFMNCELSGRGCPFLSVSSSTARSLLTVFTTRSRRWFGENAMASGWLPPPADLIRFPLSMLYTATESEP